MQLTCPQTADFYESLDPFAPAATGVSWAGDMTSLVWFDNARELTERWHHQEQIHLATNRTSIMTPALYHPVLNTFLRSLPHTYRNVAAEANTALLVEVSGECGGTWCLLRSHGGWAFTSEFAPAITSHITIPQSIAWSLFTKGIDQGSARAQVSIRGNIRLAEHVLQLVAIVG
jgi:hypothetical protein